MAWNVKIMAVRVRANLVGALSTRYDLVARGIRYAVDEGARVINLSLLHGSGDFSTMRQAIDHAYGKGVLVVQAAGNQDSHLEDEPHILHEKVMYVAGTDHFDRKAEFSSFGRRVDVCAPFYATTTDLNQKFAIGITGTSLSTPYVSGLASLSTATISEESTGRRVSG